jgi:hypothetical protein
VRDVTGSEWWTWNEGHLCSLTEKKILPRQMRDIEGRLWMPSVTRAGYLLSTVKRISTDSPCDVRSFVCWSCRQRRLTSDTVMACFMLWSHMHGWLMDDACFASVPFSISTETKSRFGFILGVCLPGNLLPWFYIPLLILTQFINHRTLVNYKIRLHICASTVWWIDGMYSALLMPPYISY